MSLESTLHSIYAQNDFSGVNEILIVVDGNTINKDIKAKILHPKLRIIERPQRVGQSGVLNYIFKISSSDLLIITNDDVILDINAVRSITDGYTRHTPDLLTGTAIPLQGRTPLEKILALSYSLNHTIIKVIGKDSYLSCNGRLIALSQQLYKKVVIPEKLKNSDAYLYLFAKINNATYYHSTEAKVRFRSPSTLREHLRQSEKFQDSQIENQHYFKENITSYYQIPRLAALKAFFIIFLRQPFLTLCYVFVHIYSRLIPRPPVTFTSGYWDTDTSTKNIANPMK